MYKVITNGNVTEIEKEINDKGLMIETIELNAGIYKVVCKEGAPKGTICKFLLKGSLENQIEELSTFKGELVKTMLFTGGRSVVIGTFDAKTVEKIEKELEKKAQEEAKAKAKAEKDEKIAELEAKKKALEAEIEATK